MCHEFEQIANSEHVCFIFFFSAYPVYRLDYQLLFGKKRPNTRGRRKSSLPCVSIIKREKNLFQIRHICTVCISCLLTCPRLASTFNDFHSLGAIDPSYLKHIIFLKRICCFRVSFESCLHFCTASDLHCTQSSYIIRLLHSLGAIDPSYLKHIIF